MKWLYRGVGSGKDVEVCPRNLDLLLGVPVGRFDSKRRRSQILRKDRSLNQTNVLLKCAENAKDVPFLVRFRD